MFIAEARCCAKKDKEASTVITSTPISSSENDEAESEPTPKLSKMDACFMRLNGKKNSTSKQTDSVVAQFDKFLPEEGHQHVLDAVAYWRQSSAKYPALGLSAKRVLCVPTTSAPVERVFSQGEIIVRPHR